jgi:hypothetical protein
VPRTSLFETFFSLSRTPISASRVLLMCLEDDKDEILRRIRACCLAHGIDQSWLTGYLFVCTANGQKFAVAGKFGVLEEGKFGGTIEEIVMRKRIDVLFIDPFIKSHGCGENDNNAIDFVCTILSRMAHRQNIAIEMVHHVSKGVADDPGNADRARGATAMINACRIAHTLGPMSGTVADLFGITDKGTCWSYIRLDSAKTNLRPPATDARWYRLISQNIGNGQGLYPNGDEVQTVKPVEFYNALAVIETDHVARDLILDDISRAAADELWVTAAQASNFVHGVFVVHMPKISKAQTTAIMKKWLADKVVELVEFTGKHGKQIKSGIRVVGGSPIRRSSPAL